jgi:thiol-disulfide isomerase/thioredoxin
MAKKGFILAHRELDDRMVERLKESGLDLIGIHPGGGETAAQVLDDLLSKGEPGSQMPALKVKGELQTWKKSKSVEMELDKLGYGRNIVIFYTEGCSNCAAQKKAAQELLALAKDKKLPANERKSIKKIAVFLVNMDEILTENSELAGQLFNAFDMSVLPFLVQSDSSGKITRRYFSLLE